ncbi:hypothetical protein [Salinisphaera sp. T31B1]|uniref:hypothetical protein n=1 Tax=Salinisphaera sp. T31B1 TaxID=727963 RepID=UPI00333E797D
MNDDRHAAGWSPDTATAQALLYSACGLEADPDTAAWFASEFARSKQLIARARMHYGALDDVSPSAFDRLVDVGGR